MKKVLVINGSPRKNGNSVHLSRSFTKGCISKNAIVETIDLKDITILPCTGCLRCNLVKKCTIRNDDWEEISAKILNSDVIVFSSPVYFHHVTAPMKMLLDRFRSFVHVQITETGLKHTAHQKWSKEIVLLLTLGSSDDADTKPIINLFEYLRNILGENNRLHVLVGTRLAVSNHIIKSEEELLSLYPKLNLSKKLASIDAIKNVNLLSEAYSLGTRLI